MKWKAKIQKLGRVQIPTAFLKAYSYKPGHKILIEDDSSGKSVKLTFTGGRK